MLGFFFLSFHKLVQFLLIIIHIKIYKMKKSLLLISIISYSFVFSQTKSDKIEIVKKSNVDGLKSLILQFNLDFLEREIRINKYLLENPLIQRKSIDDNQIKEIYDIVGNEIYYYQTTNANSSKTGRTNKLYNGGGLGLNIQGHNMTAFVWDGGSARSTHTEYNNKVISADGANIVNHATHVMGTIVAQGYTPSVKGIAFDASGVSYDWTNDYSEMSSEASVGMLVSNHSYYSGPITSQWLFGSYDNRARSFDLIAFDAPFYLAVTAAGNDRNDFNDAIIGPYLTSKGGYNLTRGMQNAKNFLTVGAVNEVLNYNDSSSVIMSTFSSWGPSDDGRIKPEVVTKGTSVLSTTSTSDTSTGFSQGTSMASPGVAGTALLLQQYYKSLNPTYMRSASLKGLIMHAADEAGWDQGPDYQYGWGLINAEKAANIITKKPLLTSVIEENTLNNFQTFTKSVYASGTEPLMVSVSWTDRAGTANTTSAIDPTNLNLVNDLDVRIVRNATIHFPWTLDPANPSSAAIRTTDNFRDNFEKIEIDTPVAGEYTVQITHKGTLVGGSQNYSLIVSGVNQNLTSKDFDTNKLFVSIYPNPVTNVLNFVTQENTILSQVSVLDISGKEIIKNNSISNNSLDVSSLQAGVYFIKFTSEDKSTTKKFIKE
jgi:serine protease AprX